MARSQGQILWERSRKRVRVRFGGAIVADTKRATLLVEPGVAPAWHFPQADVRMELLVPTGTVSVCACKGPARYCDVRVGGRLAPDASYTCPDPPPGTPDLSGTVAFVWDSMDAWFEEEEQVWGHPKDPRHRLDALQSARHVRVSLGGVLIAESRRPVMLFETGRGPVPYLPALDVATEHLVASSHETRCAYKGLARHWSVRAGERTADGGAWVYPAPQLEAARLAGLYAFDAAAMDVTVDGERLT